MGSQVEVHARNMHHLAHELLVEEMAVVGIDPPLVAALERVVARPGDWGEKDELPVERLDTVLSLGTQVNDEYAVVSHRGHKGIGSVLRGFNHDAV